MTRRSVQPNEHTRSSNASREALGSGPSHRTEDGLTEAAGENQTADVAPPAEAQLAEPGQVESPDRFPLVGIGASAGGFTALKKLLGGVPEDSGLAYVVIVHLSPEHKSQLPDLLQPFVKIPVEQVTETVKLERNRVYVIPPNANLDTIDSHLRLGALEPNRKQRAPIDHFFRTLAGTHGREAIGVILTGTGSDGTLGMKQIKEAGGLTIVQDPLEAEYDGMPQSAISTGIIDLIRPLADIPDAILGYASTRPAVVIPDNDSEIEDRTRRLLQAVFLQLRKRTNRDFSHYKRSTILRRITRRMQFHRIEDLNTYVEYLTEHPDEARKMADDLLITVTNFFRDPEVYELLEREVLPQLCDNKGPDDTVRIWSVGCATGEEAYSIAMLLLEYLERQDQPCGIQIFASDLHERSLERAREGFYPGDITADVTTERLQRFFHKENGGYRIRKEVRELVVFAPHNLLSDPPFSRIDMITCRNVLIYLERQLQKDVAQLFHYAIRPDGLLLVGTSESIDAPGLFRSENKQCCLYRRLNTPTTEPRLPVFPLARSSNERMKDNSERALPTTSFGSLHQRLLGDYAPASILVSPEDRIVHLSERSGGYLSYPSGDLTSNFFKLLREEFRIELRSILPVVRQRRESISTSPIPTRFDGEQKSVVVHVHPSLQPNEEGFLLILFEDVAWEPDRENPTGLDASGAHEGQTVRTHLQAELDLTHQRLQSIIEEYETTQEELKASNEELQSANEELRSTLEELETSREELQSMNEELQTVNQENRHKVEELSQLTSDLQNLLSATEIATLFLDREMRIM
jgi:two-component system, chemotaxis family, CheB/CheR fusion protein